jgi:hypothetical protein
MMDLPRERQPDPALEERVVSALMAAGLVRRRRRSRASILLAVAAALVLAIGFSVWRTRHVVGPGNTYVLLLYEDSTYLRSLPGHGAERVAELSRWADSLATLGQLDVGGHLVGSEAPGGLFIIRARSDSDAARIAASCPFVKYGGRIDVRRFIE